MKYVCKYTHIYQIRHIWNVYVNMPIISLFSQVVCCLKLKSLYRLTRYTKLNQVTKQVVCCLKLKYVIYEICYIFIYIHVCIYNCVHKFIHISYIQTHTHTYTYTYTHTLTHTHTHTYMYIYTHTNIHIHIHNTMISVFSPASCGLKLKHLFFF
jgi:hypothetical protein